MSKHTGQVALITGAAGGIGSAVATALHRRGASIVLVDMASTDLEAVAAKLGNQRVAIA